MSSFVKDLSHPTKRAKNNTLQVIDKVAKNRKRNEAANPQSIVVVSHFLYPSNAAKWWHGSYFTDQLGKHSLNSLALQFVVTSWSQSLLSRRIIMSWLMLHRIIIWMNRAFFVRRKSRKRVTGKTGESSRRIFFHCWNVKHDNNKAWRKSIISLYFSRKFSIDKENQHSSNSSTLDKLSPESTGV